MAIKGYDEEFGIYRLGFPNREVEEGLERLFKIGINFSNRLRNIEEWIIEK